MAPCPATRIVSEGAVKKPPIKPYQIRLSSCGSEFRDIALRGRGRSDVNLSGSTPYCLFSSRPSREMHPPKNAISSPWAELVFLTPIDSLP